MPIALDPILPDSAVFVLAASRSYLPGMLMASGVLLLTFWFLVRVRKKLRRPGQPIRRPLGRKPSFADAASRRNESSARQSIEAITVEAEELVRRMAAHLDNKSAKIELLIKQADERLEQLQKAVNRSSKTGSAIAYDGADRSDTNVQTHPIDPTSQNVYQLSDDGLAPIQIAQKLSEGVGKVELILALRDN